ncbi:MAG: YqgE/AlgH family protein [Pseudohongiellaceae bacterium]|jgi:putative transcriptional regulator
MSHPETASDACTSLENHFLVAMPQLQDSWFGRSVVYIWRHNEDGALGLVVNKPIDLRMGEIFEQLGVTCLSNASAQQIVLAGGPVETQKGFVLHDAAPHWPSSLIVADGLTLTTSRDILADIAAGKGPARYLLALGCAGWSPGQLEQELKDNAWFTCPATTDIIFSTDHARKPEMVAARLGFSLSQLTSNVGYS